MTPEVDWERWLKYLGSLDWGSGQRDVAAWNAFLRAASLAVAPKVAQEEVVRRIATTGGAVSPAKIHSQMRRAYSHCKRDHAAVLPCAPRPRASFSLEHLKAVAKKHPEVNEAWLNQRSAMPPADLTSATFLNQLYADGERLLVFTKCESQGQVLYEVGAKVPEHLPAGGEDGVWLLANPVDGHYHANPRLEGKPSRRSEEAITAWRYMVVESDEAPTDLWLSALAQLPLRITAIYSSGGKSIHALVRVDSATKPEWDVERNAMSPTLVALGADPNALTAVRLTRLPGAMRGGTLQKLIYINPDADGTPIIAHEDPRAREKGNNVAS